MKFRQMAAVLPCRKVEDLSLCQGARESDELLAAWSTLWHPTLLAVGESLPHWISTDSPPEDADDHLLLVPEHCVALLPEGWLDRAAARNSIVLRTSGSRPETVAAALEQLDAVPPCVDPELAADFLALGFCHFQVAMLMRHLPYSSDLDLDAFCAEVLDAAKAALAADEATARRGLRAALDRLQQAREFSYPSELYLLDLTLTAPTTLGQPLRDELARGLPMNLLISGELIEEMSHREPATLRAVREAIGQGDADGQGDAIEQDEAAGQCTLEIVGGEYAERDLALMPHEAIRRQIERGLASYEKHLGTRPTVFGRRRFGLTPVLPRILERIGFVGGVHFTLDGGRFPVANHHSRVCWEGLDTTPLQTVARVPLDAGQSETFLLLPESMADRLAGDHAATLVFAHWPGQTSPWYEDLRRIAALSPVLGTFRTLGDFLDQTQLAAEPNRYQADEYRSPYLDRAVADGQTDPISRWVRFFSRETSLDALETLRTLGSLVSGRPESGDDAAEDLSARIDRALAADEESDGDDGPNDDPSENPSPPAPLPAGGARGGSGIGTQPDGELDRRIRALLNEAAARLGQSLAGASPSPHGVTLSPRRGCLSINPLNSPRRVCIETPGLKGPPEVADAVRAVDASSKTPSAVVDLPGLGFAWVGPDVEENLRSATAEDNPSGATAGLSSSARLDSRENTAGQASSGTQDLTSSGTRSSAVSGSEKPNAGLLQRAAWWRRGRKQDPPLAEENVLRNEYFEVVLDPLTGAIRSIFDHRHRSARLSQQLAMRMPYIGQESPDDDEAYSIMRANQITVTSSGPLLGEIVSEGELVDRAARPLARFRQTTRVGRGSRIVELRIELDVDRLPDDDPWNSYYAARFAWGDATADLYRGVGLANLPTELTRLDAPHFVEVRGEDTRTTLLCGGLPYHRRLGFRKLDTLLVVRGETARCFRIGLGIDLPHPVPAALGFMVPPRVLPEMPLPPSPSGWLFDLDVANVLATHWEPLVAAGRIEGFRVRLFETDGRRTPLGLGCFRRLASAEKHRAANTPPEPLLIADDRVKLTLAPHEWAEVVARFEA